METILTDRFIKIGETTIDKDSYYTPEQTEDILGVERVTIDRRVRAGLLKRSGTARNILYKGEDIVDYLEQGRL